MDACWLNHIFWELLSIVTLSLVGVFWLIERISKQRFAMNELLIALFAVVMTFIVWVKLAFAVPAYRLDGVVDLILGCAMSVLAVHFIFLILRASHVTLFAFVERWLLVLVGLAWVAYGVYLFIFGTPVCFASLDAMVNMFLQPFWIVAILVLFARARFA